MSVKGRRKRREPWEVLLDDWEVQDPGSTNGKHSRAEESEEKAEQSDPHADPSGVTTPTEGGTDEVTDVDDHGKKRVVEQAPLEMGDGYVGQRTQIKFRIDGNGDQERALASLAPADMVQSGHGFMIDDCRSRQWKTAKRTHCAHCGGPLPRPNVTKYACEFDPEATELELSLVGGGQGPDDRTAWPGRRSESYRPGCQCSGCLLRHLVSNGDERNVGGPRKVCSKDCGRLRDNELKRWKGAVRRAEERGQEPPPEPEDKGLKFVRRNGPRSSSEGSGHRYVAAVGMPWSAPRA